jgi:hypothetical protein
VQRQAGDCTTPTVPGAAQFERSIYDDPVDVVL